MSVTARFVSGSLASWTQIALGMAGQIVLVPVYLMYWDVKTYGIWLAIQAIVSLFSMLDFGHQQFIGYEFLRIGKNDRKAISKYLWSGALMGVCISLFQISLVIVLVLSGALLFIFGEQHSADTTTLDAAGIVLILQMVAWLIATSVAGLITRLFSAIGYFPRMAWWGTANTTLIMIVPLIAVILGGNLLVAGIVTAAASIAYCIPLYIDLQRLLRREMIAFSRPSLRLGYTNFILSLALTGKFIFDNVRQQGARLVLAPLSGATGLAAFSTMRTGANVALQGLNTITNPLMPDMISFLHERDQAKTDSAFGVIWIVVIAMLCPGVIILQAFVEPFFVLWTDGQITFDPSLFALLSMGVLVYAIVQPAMSVVMGNNMLRPQFVLSCLAAAIVIGGTFSLVPVLGLLGAGLALLLAEMCLALGYLLVAKKWLATNEMRWPKQAFLIALVSICIAGAAMIALIIFPQEEWFVVGLSLALLALNLGAFWKKLPAIAREKVIELIGRLPGLKNLISKT